MIGKISFVDFKYLKKFLKDEKNISYKLDEQYMEFKKSIIRIFFENISFKIEYENVKVLCPPTIQFEKEKLNFLVITF